MLVDKIQGVLVKTKVFFSLLIIFGFSFILNKNISLQDSIFHLNSLFTPVERFQYTVKNYSQLADNIENLQKEVIALKLENRKLKKKSNVKIEQFKEITDAYDFISSNVLFFYPGLTATSFVVDRGVWRGVTKDMAVIDSKGVLGKVVKTSQNVALVITINDPSFRIGVKTSDDLGIGVVQFSGNHRWSVNHINDGDKFKEHDTLYTSGFGGIFPKDIPFGYISKIEKVDFSYYPEIEVTPFANYKNPNHVFLVKNLIAREINE